jgi:hypothetical protein
MAIGSLAAEAWAGARPRGDGSDERGSPCPRPQNDPRKIGLRWVRYPGVRAGLVQRFWGVPGPTDSAVLTASG